MPPSEGGDRGSIPREGTKARLKKCPAALFTLLSGGVCFTQQSETTSRGRGNFRVATRKLSVTSETYDMICPMYVVIFGISYLLVSTLPMMAMKFSRITFKKLLPFLILTLVLLTGGLSFGWLAVPITFIAYVIISLSFKQQES